MWTADRSERAIRSTPSWLRTATISTAAVGGFRDADLVDLDDELRAAFRARAVPEPRAVASDAQHLHDERRYDVPVTIITCQFPSALLREWILAGHPYVAELARMRDVEYVDLPTGHWPQFTKPAELGRAILAAVDRHSSSRSLRLAHSHPAR